MEVKHALVASEAKRQQLMKVNNNLSGELRIMQKKVTCHKCQDGRRVDPSRHACGQREEKHLL